MLYRKQGKELDEGIVIVDKGYRDLAKCYNMIGTPEAKAKAEKTLSKLSTAKLPVVDKRAGVTAKSLLKEDAKAKAKKARASGGKPSRASSAGAAIPKMKWSQTKRDVRISFYDLVKAQEESVSLLVDAKRRLLKFKVMHGVAGEREFTKMLSLGGAVVGVDIKWSEEEAGGDDPKSKPKEVERKARGSKKAKPKADPEEDKNDGGDGDGVRVGDDKVRYMNGEIEYDVPKSSPPQRVVEIKEDRKSRRRSFLDEETSTAQGEEAAVPTGVDDFDDFADALEDGDDDDDDDEGMVERKKEDSGESAERKEQASGSKEAKGKAGDDDEVAKNGENEDHGDKGEIDTAEVTFKVLQKGSWVEIIIPKAAGEKKMWDDLEVGRRESKGAKPYASKRNEDDWSRLIEDELKLQKDEAKAMRMMAEWINDSGRNGTTVKFA